MAKSLAGLFMILTALLATAGCAPDKNLVIEVAPEVYAPRDASLARRAIVDVTDIRQEADLERQSLGVYIGGITLEPAEIHLIRDLVAARADVLLASGTDPQPPTIMCGIREFEIETPSTVLYWDVTTRIELVIRVHGEDRIAAGSGVKRTYVWPGKKIIMEATEKALHQLVGEVDTALNDLLAARSP